MSNSGLIVTLIIGVLSILIVVLPFVQQRQTSAFTPKIKGRKQADELHTNYERILATIHDLDEDYNAGKLNEADYQQERAYWVEQGIILLKAQEALGITISTVAESSSPQTAPKEADQALDAAVEAAIAAYLNATQTGSKA